MTPRFTGILKPEMRSSLGGFKNSGPRLIEMISHHYARCMRTNVYIYIYMFNFIYIYIYTDIFLLSFKIRRKTTFVEQPAPASLLSTKNSK